MNKQPIRQLAVYVFLLALTFAATNILYYRAREPKVVYYKAEALFSNQDFTAAIPLYQRALNEGERRKNLYLHLGDAYTSVKEFSQAAQLYRDYLAMHPQDREIRLRLARTLSWQGDLAGAEQEYHQLVVQNEEEEKEHAPKASR